MNYSAAATELAAEDATLATEEATEEAESSVLLTAEETTDEALLEAAPF
ncbi:MAG: hypothetical protein PHE68_03240 [Candidatus Peribacteraceae bacterium]|nr:hypothetical protein [Candidatus Peribacteraceae bacterium]